MKHAQHMQHNNQPHTGDSDMAAMIKHATAAAVVSSTRHLNSSISTSRMGI
jgi:hypothetical protein